jgi:uncharacterized protein YndB with AHSA1/START domain
MNTPDVRYLSVTLQVVVDVSIDRLWACLVDDIDSWWGQPYISSTNRIALRLNPVPGGTLFEDWDHGNGRIWATVTAVQAPVLLELTGVFMMPGALAGHVLINLEGNDAKTTLNLTHHAMGSITDDSLMQWTNGWNDLLTSLSTHASEK